MHTFIITGGDLNSRAGYVHELCTARTELIHLFAEKSVLTIKQIQDLSIPLSISPRLPRLVFIEEANTLTLPAQNALLKMLEEPPESTTFYLTCASKSSLLPTVLSRAKLIQLGIKELAPDPVILSDLKTIMTLSPGDRLVNIVKRDRAESLVWLAQLELALKQKLHDKSLPQKSLTMLANIARLALSTSSALLANCSVSLTTQNFYLRLPHTNSPR